MPALTTRQSLSDGSFAVGKGHKLSMTVKLLPQARI